MRICNCFFAANYYYTVWHTAEIGQRPPRLFVPVDVVWHTFKWIDASFSVDFTLLVREIAWFENGVKRPVSHKVAEAAIFVD